MTQIIDQVARHIELAIMRHGVPEIALEGTIDDARAILQHLRDNPTPEMIEAGARAWFDRIEQVESAEDPIAASFSAILNTALGEE